MFLIDSLPTISKNVHLKNWHIMLGSFVKHHNPGHFFIPLCPRWPIYRGNLNVTCDSEFADVIHQVMLKLHPLQSQ